LQNKTICYSQQHQKGTNFHQNRIVLVHIAELSTAVIEVATKVTNASSTQNQCLQCISPPQVHVEITRPRDDTELNNGGMSKLRDIHYQTEPNLSFFPKDLIDNDCTVILGYFSCIRSPMLGPACA